MREIKFRGWNTNEKRMVDLHAITPLALDCVMNDQLALKGGSGLFLPFIEGITLMQYTGLKDKNGVEIYEGDICEGVNGHIVIVVYQAPSFVLKEPKKSGDYKAEWFTFIAHPDNPQFEEVIGNIHEHPELLK